MNDASASNITLRARQLGKVYVTGEVAVRLFKGTATAIAAKSDQSLYREDLATFGASATFDHADSRGFVKLYGLPGTVAARVQGSGAGS